LKGVSSAVVEVLRDYNYLKPALRRGLVNYSALAREVKPKAEARLGRKVTLEAVVAALRRASPFFCRGPRSDLYSIVKACVLRLRNDMVCVHYKRTPELFLKLSNLEKRVNWEEAERMYVIQRTEEIGVVATRKFYKDLLALGGKGGELVLEASEKLALVTVVYPHEGTRTVGLSCLLASQFEELGVNIVLQFDSFSHLSFLIAEEDAPAIFERLSSLVREAVEKA